MPASQDVIKAFTKVIGIGVKAVVPGGGLFVDVIGGIAEGTVNFGLDASKEQEARDFVNRILHETAKTVKDYSPTDQIRIAGYAEVILNFHALTPADIAEAGFSAANAADKLLKKPDVQDRLASYPEIHRKPTVDVLRAFYIALMTEKEMALKLEAEFRRVVMERLTAQTTPREAAQALVEIPVIHHTGTTSPGQMLRAEYSGAVPFTGRDAEMTDLKNWVAEESKVRITLYTGAGGMGKTRLMLELCRQMEQAGWRTGFINSDANKADSGVWAAMTRLNNKTLLVMDYAETRMDKELIPLLKEAGRVANEEGDADRELRIVLVSRSAGEWWSNLWGAAHDAGLRSLHENNAVSSPFELGKNKSTLPLDDRVAIYKKTVETFARVINGEQAAPVIPAIPDDIGEEHFNNVLLIQMRAFMQIFGDAILPTGGKEAKEQAILNSFMGHERGYWNKDRKTPWQPRVIDGLVQCMAAITLAGGVSEDDALKLLGTTEGLKGQLLEDISDLLHKTYPGTHWINPVMPDILGEHFVHQCGIKDGGKHLNALLDVVFGAAGSGAPGLIAAGRRHGLTVLARLAIRTGDEGMLRSALEGRFAFFGKAVVDVALESGGTLADIATELFKKSPDAKFALNVVDGLPFYSVKLNEFSLLVTQAAYDAAKQVKAGTDEKLNFIATLANNLSVRLSNIGRREEALAAAEESVTLRRGLVRKNPDAFNPDLAGSLYNLGDELAKAGREAEGLPLMKEAVDIMLPLTLKHPAAFQKNFLMFSRNYMETCQKTGTAPDAQLAVIYNELLKELESGEEGKNPPSPGA